MSKCECHRPPAWERPERDSDNDSASDWYSGDEAPEDSVGDERMLTRDGQAKKMVQSVGKGQQRPGKHDLVTLRYTVWRVELEDDDEDEEVPRQDPLRWSRQGPRRIEELSTVESSTVALGKGHLPVGVEVCVRMMQRHEKALVQCNGCYGMLAAPIFGKRPEEEKENVPGKLFFRGKLRESKKLKFLPGCPENPGTFVFRHKRLCPPEAKLEIEVELIDFLSVHVLTDDTLVRKVLVARGRGTRKPDKGDSVTLHYSLMDPAEDSLAVAAAEFCSSDSPMQTVSCCLDEHALPYGRGLARVLTTMRQGERAIVFLGGHYRNQNGSNVVEDAKDKQKIEDVRLLCTLVSFSRCRELEAVLRSGLILSANSGGGGCVASRFLKEELRRAPDDLRVIPMEGGAVLVAFERGCGRGFEILSWRLGNGATPRLWDAAAESLQLYEYAAFRAPESLWLADRPTLAYEGRTALRHLADCSSLVTAGIEALCYSDPNEEDIAPEVSTMLQELVRPGWAECIGNEVEWHAALGTFTSSTLPSGETADGGQADNSHSDERLEAPKEASFRWVLLAVSEALDAGELDDRSKAFCVQQHRALGTALVKEGSFEEASAAYTRALDACRLHSLYKFFFPSEHGESFRGVSSIYGAQSYQPQLPERDPDPSLVEEHAWVREAAMACHSNLALCALRQKKYRECVEHAGWILVAEPQNAKALFRRGVATACLGKDLEGALRDLEAARALQPEDAALKVELARVKEKMKAARKAEKAMFQGILK